MIDEITDSGWYINISTTSISPVEYCVMCCKVDGDVISKQGDHLNNLVFMLLNEIRRLRKGGV